MSTLQKVIDAVESWRIEADEFMGRNRKFTAFVLAFLFASLLTGLAVLVPPYLAKDKAQMCCPCPEASK